MTSKFSIKREKSKTRSCYGYLAAWGIHEKRTNIWIGLMLLICAGFSAYAGASQLEQAKQRTKHSQDAFTERRNGVSCICLAILFVILGIGINL